MDIQGKVIVALPERAGVSARGEWKAQDFVIETHEAYPHKLVFTVFGADRLARFNIQIGQEIMLSFDIDAHEYNGRWFNSIRAYDVRQVDPSQYSAPESPTEIATNNNTPTAELQNSSTTSESFPPSQNSIVEQGTDDDLPF